MNTGNLDLTAYQSVPIKKVGTFIYIIASQGDVIVKGKGINARLKNNQGIQVAEQFDSLEMRDVSGAPNSVDYVIGNGEFLNAEISAEITGGKIQPIGGADNLTNQPWSKISEITPRMLNLAGAFYLSDALNSLNTIVAPAANINGVVVLGVGCNQDNTGTARFMYGQSAPTSWNDASAGTILLNRRDVASQSNIAVELPIIIPAGHGIYFNQSTLNSTQRFMEYEFL